MPGKNRAFPWLVALFGLLLLLLLLSALVETPAAPAAEISQPAAVQYLAAMPLTPESTVGWRGLADVLRLFTSVICAVLPLPLLCICRDRNGRVLRAGRYVRSFYPIFRQELACG